MTSTGTADCDGQIVSVVTRVIGKPAGDKMIDVAVHSFRLGLALQIIDDVGIDTALGGEFWLIMRIGKAAHIEDEVGVERHAVLVAERLEKQCKLRRIDADEVLDPAP